MCVIACMSACVLVRECVMHAKSDSWWAEGGRQGKFKNGMTDGLIAKAGLNHE